MKKYLLNLFYNFFNKKKLTKFQQINKTLEKGLKEKEFEKLVLKLDIRKEVKKFMKYNSRSKYIPKENKNKEELIQFIKGKFGNEMFRLNMVLKDDLTLCDK